MIGTLDSQVAEKFNGLKKQINKYHDLNVEEIKFENISLSNSEYFEFIKGKNKYIQRYITKNPGRYPILGASLKNECISNYIEPIDENDIIDKTCVSFNKDNAKGSLPFYRDYPFLMDRHHIAIIPTEKVSSKYLNYSLIYYFEKSKFGWGDNVASVDEVKKYFIPIPKDNGKYKSIDLQIMIVEFLEKEFENLNKIEQNIEKRINVASRMEKSLLPSIFKKTAIKEKFSKYAKDNNIKFNIEDISFEKHDFEEFLSIVKGKAKYTKQYINNNKGEYPLYSSGTDQKTKGIMGMINTYDYNIESIQFTANGEKAGAIFYLNKHKFSMNGDRGMFIIKSDKLNMSFLFYNLKNEFKKHKFSWGNKPTNTKIREKIKIYIPYLENFDSLELQEKLAGFIQNVEDELKEQHFDKYNRAYEVTEKLRKTYLARTFSLINWSK